MTTTPLSQPSREATLAQPAYTLEDWRSGYRSQPEEFDYWIDDVEGTIPPELEGTLYRNGPGLLEVFGTPLKHPFDGDGMISSIAFRNGRAFYRNRYVRTAGYVAEQAAQKMLYRGVFGTQKPGGLLANLLDMRLKNIANTHVVYWGNRLLALWEAAEPYRLDPKTLDTMGIDDWDGVLQPGQSFSAHPRFDPGHHGQPRMVTFSVKTGLSSTITLFEFASDGALVSQYSHTVPGFAFLHDFAITPNYAIFLQNPVSMNPLGYALGLKGAAECLAYNPKQPTQILVIPRNGTDPVQVIETDPCFVFHHANAFEQDGRVYVDSICYAGFPAPQDGTDYKNVNFEEVPAGSLWRFTLDLAVGKATSECLIDRCVEFPTMHPDKVGLPARYLFIGTAHASTGNAPLQAVLKLDVETGEQQIWSAAPRGFGGEPVFVPRPGAIAEDDGWLLLLAYNAERQCSDLVILNGRDLTAGPLARLKLKHHVPYGLHGSFVDTYFGPDA